MAGKLHKLNEKEYNIALGKGIKFVPQPIPQTELLQLSQPKPTPPSFTNTSPSHTKIIPPSPELVPSPMPLPSFIPTSLSTDAAIYQQSYEQYYYYQQYYQNYTYLPTTDEYVYPQQSHAHIPQTDYYWQGLIPRKDGQQ